MYSFHDLQYCIYSDPPTHSIRVVGSEKVRNYADVIYGWSLSNKAKAGRNLATMKKQFNKTTTNKFSEYRIGLHCNCLEVQSSEIPTTQISFSPYEKYINSRIFFVHVLRIDVSTEIRHLFMIVFTFHIWRENFCCYHNS